MYGTRLLINPDVPEVVMVRKSMYYREISQYLSVLSGKPVYVNENEVLYSTERKTIKELRAAVDVGFYVVLATVLDVEHVLSWWYKSCVCSVKIYQGRE
ncbi:Replication factor-A carboxy-terminal domain protein [Arachis hypogaea]|nr:Replication factor-A carboxy-terminal domain protein [Arachis hypogaea]